MKNIKIITTFLILFAATWGFSQAHASPDLDRLYSFESVGWLKPTDNIDGIFNDLIQEEYERYFQNQKRFIIKKFQRQKKF